MADWPDYPAFGAMAVDDLPHPYRRATPEDSAALADLVDIAGDGLPFFAWSRLAGPGEVPAQVGARRLRCGEGGFSYREAIVADPGYGVVAALLGYALLDTAPPSLPLRPLLDLQGLARGTWYVSVLAAYPGHRSRGHGTRLLGLADQFSRVAGCRGLSLAVTDANAGARRLYERLGFRLAASRPFEKGDWPGPGGRILLLVRDGAE